MEMNPSHPADEFHAPAGSAGARARTLRVFHVNVDGPEFRIEKRALNDPSSLAKGNLDYRSLIDVEPLGTLSPRSFRRFERELRKCEFEAFVIHIPEFPELYLPFPHRNPLRNIAGVPSFAAFSTKLSLLRRLVNATTVPLLIFDNLDAITIDGRWLPFFPRCTAYFKRELPKCPVNAFLYSERVATEAWKNAIRYKKQASKLRPVSEGFDDAVRAMPVPAVKKDIDIFWAGNTTISPVRERGLELLKKLRAEGYAIDLCEKKVSREEFYQRLARSYLVWSPEGTAWQCYRHMEVCAMQSVPVISYPTIWQDMPLAHGIQCLYYDPEGTDLIRVVKEALEDRMKLERMGREARPFICRYHAKSAVYARHVFEQVPA